MCINSKIYKNIFNMIGDDIGVPKLLDDQYSITLYYFFNI
jgi:hypothetical protein